MNKFASFYVIFAFSVIEFEDFCVYLQRVLVRDIYLLLNFLSRITTSEKKNEQKSKYAGVSHYSADFSIAYLGLVVSLREIMAGLRYLYSEPTFRTDKTITNGT